MQLCSSLSILWQCLSCIGEGNGNPLQCYCLENPRDGGLPSVGSHRVGHDWSDLAVAAAHTSKAVLKILQARLQQYAIHEIPDVQAGFRKDRGTRDQVANIWWTIKTARESQKNVCFIDYAKAFDCVDHNKLWKTLKEMGIPDHLTCLLRNLYAGQEATVWIGHGTTDWF